MPSAWAVGWSHFSEKSLAQGIWTVEKAEPNNASYIAPWSKVAPDSAKAAPKAATVPSNH